MHHLFFSSVVLQRARFWFARRCIYDEPRCPVTFCVRIFFSREIVTRPASLYRSVSSAEMCRSVNKLIWHHAVPACARGNGRSAVGGDGNDQECALFSSSSERRGTAVVPHRRGKMLSHGFYPDCTFFVQRNKRRRIGSVSEKKPPP